MRTLRDLGAFTPFGGPGSAMPELSSSTCLALSIGCLTLSRLCQTAASCLGRARDPYPAHLLLPPVSGLPLQLVSPPPSCGAICLSHDGVSAG